MSALSESEMIEKLKGFDTPSVTNIDALIKNEGERAKALGAAKTFEEIKAALTGGTYKK